MLSTKHSYQTTKSTQINSKHEYKCPYYNGGGNAENTQNYADTVKMGKNSSIYKRFT